MSGGLVWAPVRATRPILETVRAFGDPPPPPFVCRFARDAHLRCDMRDRPSGRDPIDHDHPAAQGHRSVTVHERLLRVRVVVEQPHDPSEAHFIGGPTPTSPTWMGNTARARSRSPVST